VGIDIGVHINSDLCGMIVREGSKGEGRKAMHKAHKAKSAHAGKLARATRLLPNGIPRWVRVYDNGGETIDRYTVVYTGRYAQKTGGEHWVLGMNGAPYHPQGVGMHSSHTGMVDALGGKWSPKIGRKCHLGVRVRFEDLPEDCQRAALSDYCYLWDLYEDCGSCGGYHPMGWDGDCRDNVHSLVIG